MATRKLGVLRIDMITNTAGFTAPMTQASRVSRSTSTAIERDFDRISRSSKSAGDSISSFGGLLKSAGALVGIGSLASLADDYTNLQNRLKLVTDSQSQLDTAMKSTLEIAQRTALEWDSVGLTYEKLSKGTEKLKLSQTDLIGLTKSISEAVAISGVSSEVASQGLTQFGQALSVGALRGQDLNSVISSLPGLANAISAGLGVTTGELKKLGAEGKLTNEKITDSIKEMAGAIAEQYDKTATTISGGFTMVKNAATDYVGEVDKGVGASSALVGALGSLAKNFGAVADIIALAVWASFTKMIITQALSVRNLIAAKIEETAVTRAQQAAEVQSLGLRAQQARQTAALALTEVSLARAEYNAATSANARAVASQRVTTATIAEAIASRNATVATAAYTAATRTATGAMAMMTTAGKGLLAFLGGPIGLAITVASIAGAFLLMKNSSKEATVELDYQNKSVKELTYSYQQLSDAKLAETMSLMGGEISDIAEKMNKTKKAVIEMTDGFILTDGARKKLEKLNSEFEAGKISSDKYYSAVSQVQGVTQSMTIELGASVSKYEDQKTAFDKNRESQNLLNKISAERLRLTKENTNATTEDIRAQEKQAEILAGINSKYKDQLVEVKFIEGSIKKNESFFGGYAKAKEFAEFDKKFREDNNLALTEKLSDDLLKSLWKAWELKKMSADQDERASKNVKNQADAQRKIEKSIEAQKKANEGVLKINKTVAQNAKKYNFNSLEESFGLPRGLLTAINQKESSGNRLAVGKKTKYGTAKGGFQMLDTTAKQYGVVGNMIFDTGIAAKAAAKHLSYLYKQFRDWNKSISAYHAGEGNVRKGKNIGPINRKYVKDVGGYIAGASGQNFTEDYTAKDYIKEQEEAAEAFAKFMQEKSDLEKDYQNGRKKLEIEAQERIKNLNNYGLSEQAKLEESLLVDRFKLYDAELKFELNAFKMNENEKTLAQKEIEKLKLQISGDYSKEELELRKKALDSTYEYEVKKLKEIAAIKLAESFKGVSDMGDSAEFSISEKNNPALYQLQAFEREYEQKIQDLTTKSLEAKKDIDDHEFKSAEEKNSLLLELEREFQRSKLLIQEESRLKEQEIRDAQVTAQLESYGALMGGALDVLKGYAGESSGIYQGLFAGLKAYNTAIAAMNVWKSASDAYANEPGTVWQKAAASIQAVAQTQAFSTLIQGITPAGFAEGGFTGYGGKYDPAGIVHKGEIVFSQSDISKLGGVGAVESLRTGGEKLIGSNSSRMVSNQYNQSVNNNSSSLNPEISVINVSDPAEIAKVMKTKAGKNAIISVIKGNSTEIRKTIGV